jgi:hypothetical protein
VESDHNNKDIDFKLRNRLFCDTINKFVSNPSWCNEMRNQCFALKTITSLYSFQNKEDIAKFEKFMIEMYKTHVLRIVEEARLHPEDSANFGPVQDLIDVCIKAGILTKEDFGDGFVTMKELLDDAKKIDDDMSN